jgi:excisionase family DNA binding protein
MKRVNPRRIKIHRSYTIFEAAQLLRVERKTIQRWIKKGLPTCHDRRPILILGSDLRDFLQRQRIARKRTCQAGELYCVRCRAPKGPAGDMVDFIQTTASTGYLQGICRDCGTLINRAVSAAASKSVTGGLEVTFPRALRGLNGSTSALVDVQFRGVGDAKA